MTDRRLSRRQFLSATLTVAAGSALAACAAPAAPAAPAAAPADQAPAPAAAEPVTISLWVFWGQYEKIAPQILAGEEIKKLLGDKKLDIKWSVNADVFMTNVAGGTPPDVGTGVRYVDYMAREAVMPIGDLVASSSIVKAENFIEANWKSCSYKGVQYGVPSIECFVRRGLNYNTKMVKDAGLDPETPPVTWAEAMEWHKAITKFDEAGNLIQIGLDPYDAEGIVAGQSDGFTLADSFGFQWFDPDTHKFNLDNERMVLGLETCTAFVKLVGPDKMAGMRSVEGQGTWGGSFNAGVQAMIIEGYWHPGETYNEKPEVSPLNKATWIPVPDDRKGKKVQYGGGHMVLFYKGAKNPPAVAWPVAELLNTKEVCDYTFNAVGWLPAVKSYIEQVDPTKYPGLDFYINSVKDANEWHESPMCEIGAFVETKFGEIIQTVYRDQMTAAEAAKKYQQMCEEEYKNAGFASA